MPSFINYINISFCSFHMFKLQKLWLFSVVSINQSWLIFENYFLLIILPLKTSLCSVWKHLSDFFCLGICFCDYFNSLTNTKFQLFQIFHTKTLECCHQRPQQHWQRQLQTSSFNVKQISYVLFRFFFWQFGLYCCPGWLENLADWQNDFNESFGQQYLEGQGMC